MVKPRQLIENTISFYGEVYSHWNKGESIGIETNYGFSAHGASFFALGERAYAFAVPLMDLREIAPEESEKMKQLCICTRESVKSYFKKITPQEIISLSGIGGALKGFEAFRSYEMGSPEAFKKEISGGEEKKILLASEYTLDSLYSILGENNFTKDLNEREIIKLLRKADFSDKEIVKLYRKRVKSQEEHVEHIEKCKRKNIEMFGQYSENAEERQDVELEKLAFMKRAIKDGKIIV